LEIHINFETMPHFIIECSKNILDEVSPEELMSAVYEVADATGLFAPNDIKVRLRSFTYYKLGEGKTDFLHVFGNIMEGRTTEQKADLSKRITERLNNMLPILSFLSINITEFELATYCNKSLINPNNKNQDRYFNEGF